LDPLTRSVHADSLGKHFGRWHPRCGVLQNVDPAKRSTPPATNNPFEVHFQVAVTHVRRYRVPSAMERCAP
jgi:hypothetical protein